ncbi:hypothetical protein [Methylobacter sp.]|uniref:hypothetical protein n=1 Tax=Methylobacter sp. TaxID=2051955 RepID=UPI00260C4E60|nr:hypothetical protein [Methylobacter sp.]
MIFYSIAFAACYKKQSPVCKFHPPQYATRFKKQDENTNEEKLGLLAQAVSASQ